MITCYIRTRSEESFAKRFSLKKQIIFLSKKKRKTQITLVAYCRCRHHRQQYLKRYKSNNSQQQSNAKRAQIANAKFNHQGYGELKMRFSCFRSMN